MQPLRRAWVEVQTEVDALRPQWEATTGNAERRMKGEAEGKLFAFMERLATVQVLDPACGSGNFLYVALNCLKDLEKEVWTYAGGLGLDQPELAVTPAQLHGIEKNQFAAELAQVVIWIGYLQWKRANGFWSYTEPILTTLRSIECRDAILAVDTQGQPVEPMWPQADVIVGNPPFLGGKRLRTELGNHYVNAIFTLYDGRVPREADLVTYWFERARAMIEQRVHTRAGLLATQSVRMGANRKVLEHIKQTGNIFLAWADRPWVLDGADVRVAIVGFDNGNETLRTLNGMTATHINGDLTGAIDVTIAQRLPENLGLAFMGDTKGGPFDIPAYVAVEMINTPLNANGRPNTDVVRPWVNGLDVTSRPRNMWIIDFGTSLSEQDAALYEAPFVYVQQHVQPARADSPRVRNGGYTNDHELICATRLDL